MGNILMTGSGGGGAGSDDCTGTAAELLKGYTGILKGSDDEPVRGTLELTGNAQAAHVLNGETFYSNDAKTKHTGNMTVNSLLSFSVAAYSGRRVIATWTNPNQAAGRPYRGVIIRYDTGGYPGASGGVQIYKGAGNNHSAGAASQAFLDLPNLNTRYFLSCTPYVTTSIGELFGPTLNAEITTGGSTSRTFTASGSFVVEGFTKMDVFLVGGGGGAGYAGGGSGYTATQYGIPITTGNNVSVVVGGGGGPASNGGTSSISVNGAVKASAAGGNGAPDSYGVADGNGGSGGGGSSTGRVRGGNGGSDGGNGAFPKFPNGTGQGRTTRAWGNSVGALYAGGGAGGNNHYNNRNNEGDRVEYFNLGGTGGAGGGGNGGGWEGTNYGKAVYPTNGTPNTGGGGGGRYSSSDGWGSCNPAYGGSGIVIVNLY